MAANVRKGLWFGHEGLQDPSRGHEGLNLCRAGLQVIRLVSRECSLDDAETNFSNWKPPSRDNTVQQGMAQRALAGHEGLQVHRVSTKGVMKLAQRAQAGHDGLQILQVGTKGTSLCIKLTFLDSSRNQTTQIDAESIITRFTTNNGDWHKGLIDLGTMGS